MVLGWAKVLEDRILLLSNCNEPVTTGSKLVICGQAPRVLMTKPDAPPPAPAVPLTLVPPGPDPIVPPNPPALPPGVPCSRPRLTPSVFAPALARSTSVSAMLRL